MACAPTPGKSGGASCTSVCSVALMGYVGRPKIGLFPRKWINSVGTCYKPVSGTEECQSDDDPMALPVRSVRSPAPVLREMDQVNTN